MRVKQKTKPVKSEMQQIRNAIQRSWSSEEWVKRRRIADARQQRLYGMLFLQQTANSVQVA